MMSGIEFVSMPGRALKDYLKENYNCRDCKHWGERKVAKKEDFRYGPCNRFKDFQIAMETELGDQIFEQGYNVFFPEDFGCKFFERRK